MKRKIFIAALLLTALSAAPAFSQSKGETKLYNSTIAKGTLKAYNKFLGKYPNSVYAPKISRILDSINYSGVNKEELSAVAGYLRSYPNSAFFAEAEQRLFALAMKERYVQDESLCEYKIVEDFMPVAIDTSRYYYYAYENIGSSDPDLIEYVVSLIDKRDGAHFSAMFSGRKKKADNLLGYIVEGESMDEQANRSFRTKEMTYLLNMLKVKEFLVPISKADIMTDQAIKWWKDTNKPKAKKLEFGLVAQESSLVEAFRAQKEFETNSGYKTALFDIRDNTVIVAYQKSSKQYILVWCEPVCQNKKRDQLLNTIYFENANTLVLYYYKGRTTFKVRVNLATKQITY